MFWEAGAGIYTLYQTGFLIPSGVPGFSPALLIQAKLHYSLEVDRMNRHISFLPLLILLN